jgi:geranylgeranyl reductase family protein
MLAPDGKYDVIVVGAGPAGSTASHILSRNGLKVLLIDKCSFPRDKLCGGFLTEKATRLMKILFRESPQFLRQHHTTSFESINYSLWYRSRLLMSGASVYPFRFVNRAEFDSLLLDHARSNGTCVLEEEAVRVCDPSAGMIQTKSGQTYFARFIIGADGVSSVVRRSLPPSSYDRHEWRKHLATGVQISIPRSEFPWEVDRPMIYFGFMNVGYSWVFPGGDRVVVGMGGISRKNPEGVLTCFRSFLSALSVPEYLHEKFRSYPIPFGNHLERPGYNLALLVGDAAGFADGIFGEGLYYALKSGELAAVSILQGLQKNLPPLAIYFRSLRQFLPNLSHLSKRGRQLYFLLRTFGYLGACLYIRWKGKKLVTHIHFLRGESETNRIRYDV